MIIMRNIVRSNCVVSRVLSPVFSRSRVLSILRNIGLVFTCLSQSACLTTGSKSFQKTALSRGLEHQVLSTHQFDLNLYQKKTVSAANTLHIYIGGDGQPWLNRIYVNVDPTPTQALMLNLLTIDPSPAIYLGRPCYHSNGQGRHCDAKWWTSHRYSEAVVNAMTEAVETIIKRHSLSQLTRRDSSPINQKASNRPEQTALQVSLIGFSGGGTLATLISQRLLNIKNLVTINGNLDIEAWTQYHGYTPLYGSINPSQSATLPDKLKKFHLVGAKDTNIPFSIDALKQFKQQANTQVLSYKNHTHHCCWETVWLDFLNKYL